MALLDDDEIRQLLAGHPGWRRTGDSLERRLGFRDFAEAARFVGRLGERTAVRDPYPEVRLHDFSAVTLRLGHENRAGLSVADIRLVEELDALIAEPLAPAGGATLSAGVTDAAPAAPGPPPVRPEPVAAPPPPTPTPAPAPAATSGVPAPVTAGLVAAGALAGALVSGRRHRRRARRAHSFGLLGRR